MKYCSQCGEQHQDDVRFCVKCGTPFSNIPTASQQMPYTPPAQPTSESSNKKIIAFIAGIAGLFVVGIAIVLIVFFSNRTTTDVLADTPTPAPESTTAPTPTPIPAAPETERLTFTVDTGEISITAPIIWDVTLEPGSPSRFAAQTYNLMISPSSEDEKLLCLITISLTMSGQALSDGDFSSLYTVGVEALLPYAVEETATFTDVTLDGGYGVYTILTDAALVGTTPQQDEYLYMTRFYANFTDGYFIYSTLFTDDTDTESFLMLLESVSSVEAELELPERERSAFEQLYAVTPEQEKWLAFGPFVPVNNGESAYTLELDSSRPYAASILSGSWSVSDYESAITQLEYLSTATGQSPRGNEVWQLIRVDNGIDYEMLAYELIFVAEMVGIGALESMTDEEIGVKFGVDVSELQTLYKYCTNYVSDVIDSFYEIHGDDISGRNMEHATELFTYAYVAFFIVERTELFIKVRDMLIDKFGYTMQEIMSIETLAAWDYGRTSIIARYGYAAGYISEDEAWHYLEIAAENAHPIYNGWREYVAAHILGRAVAFGNDSTDMIDTLDYLLNDYNSPYKSIEY